MNLLTQMSGNLIMNLIMKDFELLIISKKMEEKRTLLRFFDKFVNWVVNENDFWSVSNFQEKTKSSSLSGVIQPLA